MLVRLVGGREGRFAAAGDALAVGRGAFLPLSAVVIALLRLGRKSYQADWAVSQVSRARLGCRHLRAVPTGPVLLPRWRRHFASSRSALGYRATIFRMVDFWRAILAALPAASPDCFLPVDAALDGRRTVDLCPVAVISVSHTPLPSLPLPQARVTSDLAGRPAAAMVESLFWLWFRATSWRAARMERHAGDRLLAHRALFRPSISSGGLDDDVAEDLFQLVHQRPELLDALELELHGDSWAVRKRRTLLDALRRALAAGAESTY